MMQKILKTFIVLVCFALLIKGVFAEPSAPTTLTEISSQTRNLSVLPTQSVNAQGGNVTAVNIDMLSITRSWQGYYGNITGEITLDDANNDTFYNWSIVTTQGEVYASRSATMTWSGTNCSNDTQRNAEETYLGQSVSDGDSVTNTFNTTDHPAFLVGLDSIAVDSCYSTNAFANSAQDTSRFHQVLLSDGAGNIVYTTIIDADQTGFDGTIYDFQLLVGENEHDGNLGATTYYFWIELG